MDKMNNYIIKIKKYLMKPVHRQAICITRLKKKPSNYNLASSNDVSMCRESRI